jgi:hypothetical protein
LNPPPVTFVTCVEAGPLEQMVLRMFESLRRFGGPLAGAEAAAVVARRTPPLAPRTRRQLEELNVKSIRAVPHSRYSWYHFMNKPVALLAAEHSTAGEVMVFLDADTLVLRPPSELSLPASIDVAACPSDDGVVGSTGADSAYDPEWRRIAAVNGLDADDLPWTKPYAGGPPIRLYFNGGVLAYRRKSAFGQRYLEACERALDSRAGFPKDGEHWVEQICIGIAAVAAGLRWQALSHSHNYAMASYLPGRYSPDEFRHASIVHYHDSMQKAFWPTFLERVEREQPQAYDWLRSKGPLEDETAPLVTAAAELLRIRRGLSRRRYRRAVLRRA